MGGIDRRRVLQALGAGTTVAALGTASVGASGNEHEDQPSEPTADAIDPVFGFAALSADESPPVEPDHVIDVETEPRPDRAVPEFFFEPTGLYIQPGETVQFRLVSPHHSVTAYHPALGIQQRVPDGVPPFSSPVLPVEASWLYTFDQPGVYDLHCGPHELFGHVVRLVVGEATGPGAEPVPDPEPPDEPNGDAEHGDMDDPAGHHEEPPGHREGPPDHDHGPPTADAEPPADEPESPPAEAPEPRPPIGAALTVLGDPALEPERIVEQGRVSWDEIDDSRKEIPL
ncbi:cupredoxin domain-containing protein [Salinadaptatus halalkaliphilus]|uniref:cupredoxin domain-containing protein n=1 Tax=Salinadaptatus halalkaliphilus TaxID=2419781 RepID=UPI001FEB4A7B|nr:plastocyanin [Salinadaptatus halalkaliphilus]